MDKKIFVIVIVFVALLAVAAFLLPTMSGQAPSSLSAAAKAESAPDFTVYDSEGSAVSLSDKAGKAVVLNFWATWCPYCVKEMPDFDKLYQEYGDRVEFMMIDSTDGTRETVESAAAFLAENGYTFPAYYDTAGSATNALQAWSLPTTVFIRSDGTLLGTHPGMMTEEALREAIEMLLSE